MLNREETLYKLISDRLGGRMKSITLPKHFNYIAVFLTYRCQYRCSYCINHHGDGIPRTRELTGDEWVKGLNRLRTGADLPITLQGGEPTLHKDFFSIVNGLRTDLPKDLLTNLAFDVDAFMDAIPPHIFNREAKYASIRVSYHHGHTHFVDLLMKVMRMKDAGYNIGIWEIDMPDDRSDIRHRQIVAKNKGIDYRLKELLGTYKGEQYGTMRYDGAVNSSNIRSCSCRTSELIIAPNGNIHRCHADLYSGLNPIGNILDAKLPRLGEWRSCNRYGKCNSCDIKITTNRFQEYGHSSVEIKDIYKQTKGVDAFKKFING